MSLLARRLCLYIIPPETKPQTLLLGNNVIGLNAMSADLGQNWPFLRPLNLSLSCFKYHLTYWVLWSIGIFDALTYYNCCSVHSCYSKACSSSLVGICMRKPLFLLKLAQLVTIHTYTCICIHELRLMHCI